MIKKFLLGWGGGGGGYRKEEGKGVKKEILKIY
jgi:hypothetical protein